MKHELRNGARMESSVQTGFKRSNQDIYWPISVKADLDLGMVRPRGSEFHLAPVILLSLMFQQLWYHTHTVTPRGRRSPLGIWQKREILFPRSPYNCLIGSDWMVCLFVMNQSFWLEEQKCWLAEAHLTPSWKWEWGLTHPNYILQNREGALPQRKTWRAFRRKSGE